MVLELISLFLCLNFQYLFLFGGEFWFLSGDHSLIALLSPLRDDLLLGFRTKIHKNKGVLYEVEFDSLVEWSVSRKTGSVIDLE